MTYPPQPGPHRPPRPGPYGQQPPPQDLFTPQPQQPSYQGLGTYASDPGGPPPPPRRRNTAKLIAVVVIALLVLGGGGAGVYFLTKDKGDANTGAQETSQPRPNDSNGSGPIDDTPPEQNRGSIDPAGVQQAYIEAYEAKQFSDVVNSACDAYKKKFGTNTRDLESKLEPYEVKATADGTPKVTGGNAIASIDLELTKDGETKTSKVKIKIVKESGKWKYCGDGEA